jgi:hypothetical protein
MCMHTRFLDQRNIICNKARKFQDWRTLESLKKTIPLRDFLFPTFEIPKKNGTIRVVTDVSKLKLFLKRGI